MSDPEPPRPAEGKPDFPDTEAPTGSAQLAIVIRTPVPYAEIPTKSAQLGIATRPRYPSLPSPSAEAELTIDLIDAASTRVRSQGRTARRAGYLALVLAIASGIATVIAVSQGNQAVAFGLGSFLVASTGVAVGLFISVRERSEEHDNLADLTSMIQRLDEDNERPAGQPPAGGESVSRNA